MNQHPLLSTDPRVNLIERFYALFPSLAEDKNEDWLNLLDKMQMMQVPPGTTLAKAGTSCKNFMILLDGEVRVFQDAENGREMTLYRINPGNVCLMSLNSLINHRPFKANAKAETALNIILLSADDFQVAMKVSDAFRDLILSSLVDTVCTMMSSFYDVAFEPLEMRLACLLGRLFERAGTNELEITHQALSLEIGTSREVVSRLLKALEKQECIQLQRGKIILESKGGIPMPSQSKTSSNPTDD